jgi:hypothetical protein
MAEDFDAASVRFNTNYGATGLLKVLSDQQKASVKRRKATMGLLSSIQKMDRMSAASSGSMRGLGGGKGHKGGPKHHGKMPHSNNERFEAFMKAISGQESGDDYGAVNSSSGAAGKYQIMPGNFVGPGGWDKEALGRDIRLRYYMRHPRAQERIARHKLRQYFRQYGARGAAQAWYGGPGAVGNDNISGGSGYPSTGGYADSILAQMRAIMNRRR